MNGQHWVHKTQHGDKHNKIKHRKQNRQQTWMDNIEYTRHNTEKKQNKNKAQKTKSAIMNGQHWVHKTQHGNIQHKNKTRKTKSAIMNGQHWVHRTQHGDKQNKNKAQKTKSATIMNGQPETLATLGIQDTTRRKTK
jgi:hypothetical protein